MHWPPHLTCIRRRESKHAAGNMRALIRMQGAAHFLEHGMFLGSKQFPGEDAMDSFLSHHAGSSNGYTEAERIVLHAEVAEDGLAGAAARLAAAATAPLLPAAALRREVRYSGNLRPTCLVVGGQCEPHQLEKRGSIARIRAAAQARSEAWYFTRPGVKVALSPHVA